MFSFVFRNPEYPDDRLNRSVWQILQYNTLCSIASLTSNNQSYIHTAYYCFNNQLNLFFISDPNTQHIRNIEANSSVAVAVSDSRQSWDNPKCGLQLFGHCQVATGRKLIDGTMLYLKRFTGLRQWITRPDDFVKGAINSQMFVITVHTLKLFDEAEFGEEVFIPLNVESSGV